MIDNVVSKILTLTDTTNGHHFVGDDFGLIGFRFQQLYLYNLSAGTVSIKFGENDDWVLLNLTNPLMLPFKFVEFWLKPTINPSTIDTFASLYKTGSI